MRRVLIAGGPGAGKSRFAREIGARLELPVLHLDAAHWSPGWAPRPADAIARDLAGWTAREAWVIDGNYTSSPGFETRLLRADMFIWLDLPLALRFWRVTRRTVEHLGRARPDLAEGCPEGFGRTKVELYAYMWRTRASHRAKLARIMARLPESTARHHLTTRREIAAFLERLP